MADDFETLKGHISHTTCKLFQQEIKARANIRHNTCDRNMALLKYPKTFGNI